MPRRKMHEQGGEGVVTNQLGGGGRGSGGHLDVEEIGEPLDARAEKLGHVEGCAAGLGQRVHALKRRLRA
jgi:hypothetical protein